MMTRYLVPVVIETHEFNRLIAKALKNRASKKL